jgi:hypothetical protein
MTRGGLALGLVLYATGAAGCKTPTPGEKPANGPPEVMVAPAARARPPGASVVKSYGAPLSGQAPLAIAEVLAKPDAFRDRTVVLEGHVRAACNKRGCWMEIAPSAEAGDPGCRVTFKDYGFFVPTDSAGARVRAEGQIVIAAVDKDMVQHLEGEGARFAAKDPSGAAREVRFVATGVELWREAGRP